MEKKEKRGGGGGGKASAEHTGFEKVSGFPSFLMVLFLRLIMREKEGKKEKRGSGAYELPWKSYFLWNRTALGFGRRDFGRGKGR